MFEQEDTAFTIHLFNLKEPLRIYRSTLSTHLNHEQTYLMRQNSILKTTEQHSSTEAYHHEQYDCDEYEDLQSTIHDSLGRWERDLWSQVSVE